MGQTLLRCSEISRPSQVAYAPSADAMPVKLLIATTGYIAGSRYTRLPDLVPHPQWNQESNACTHLLNRRLRKKYRLRPPVELLPDRPGCQTLWRILACSSAPTVEHRETRSPSLACLELATSVTKSRCKQSSLTPESISPMDNSSAFVPTLQTPLSGINYLLIESQPAIQANLLPNGI